MLTQYTYVYIYVCVQCRSISITKLRTTTHIQQDGHIVGFAVSPTYVARSIATELSQLHRPRPLISNTPIAILSMLGCKTVTKFHGVTTTYNNELYYPYIICLSPTNTHLQQLH